jgi:transient receptor potential cation channel subfamily M member 3
MVSKFLGPFVVIIGRMAYSMMRFVAFMVVAIMAYGVFRQTLLFPNEDWSWHLVRDIFFQPYFMIFGEEFVDEIDPPCGPDEEVECVAGRWLNPVIMSIYLLIAYILLVNLLIAVFNSIFAKANAISRQIWKSSRFAVIMEYEQKPLFPPPLIFVSHIFLIFKWCHRRAKGTSRSYQFEDKFIDIFICRTEEAV